MVDPVPASPTSVAPSSAAAPRPRIALVHDWLCGYRGGEAVLERLARLILDHARPAGLWVMVSDGRPLAPAIDFLPLHTSSLQEIPFASTALRRHLLPLFPRAVADLSERLAQEHRREPIDLVISTSSAAVKGLSPPPGVPHLCYCHTPPRYLWSQQEQYAAQGLISRIGLSLAGPMLRRWDAATAAHVTTFLANSTHTAAEIARCYGRESTVLHPPVRTGYFTPEPSIPRDDHWLFAGALEPYKRADLAIHAARLAGKSIIIAGAGSQLTRLRREFESPGVRFLGRVTDEQLRHLYRTASLLVFPQVEDFGIVAVEAQACGLPVVARRAGGALDTVVDGRTGSLFDHPEPMAIVHAADQLPRVASVACRQNALRFSEEVFDTRLRAMIQNSIGKCLV